MRFFAKYGIGFYFLVTLMFKVSFIVPHSFTNGLYYILMGLGLISFPVFYNKLYLRDKVRKSLSLFFYINLLNLIYLLIFDYSAEGWLYFFAKFSTFNLISLGIFYNYNFYKEAFTKYFKYIMLVLVLLGKFFGVVEETGGLERLSMGFNPNDVGVFGMLGMLSVIVLEKDWLKKKVNVVLIVFFIVIALLSGSKAALLCMGLGVVLTYGFNYRIVLSGVLFGLATFLSSKFGYLTSIDRLSIKEGNFGTRDAVYAKGIMTIEDNVLFGHGLSKYNWTNPIYWGVSEIPLGPHNTFLAIIIMYGAVFGFLFVLLLLSFIFKTFKKSIRNQDYFVRFTYFLLLITTVNGLFETLITGINEFVTILFWFSVGIVGYNYSFAEPKNRIKKQNMVSTL